MKKLMGLGLGLWLAAGMASAQQKLSLEDYLAQVKAQGSEYKGLQAAEEGYRKESHQMDLLYSPVLTANYSHLNDQSQQATVLSTDQTLADTAGVAIAEKMPFGPTLAIGYTFNDINLKYSPQLLNAFGSYSSLFLTSYYQIAPIVSLSVPLFKDFGGAQTSAGVKAVEYGLDSSEKASAFQKEGVLYGAKVAYWNLALARKDVEIRQDTLSRNQKIWEWTKRRVARNLADPPDALQAEASVREAELDLQQSMDGERSRRLVFNKYRNLATDDVPEGQENLEDSLANTHVDIPRDPPERVDLKSAEFIAQQKKATYDETYQNIYPDIMAFATWRGNGLDPSFQTANDTAFGTDHPTWTLGAQFNLPLDLFTASRTAEGYKKEYESSELTLQNKKLSVDQDWRDIRARLADVDKRLAMAAEIESLQKRNAEEQKSQLELGRSTQFQLIQIENGYSLARLRRLNLVAEKLGLLAEAQWWLSAQ